MQLALLIRKSLPHTEKTIKALEELQWRDVDILNKVKSSLRKLEPFKLDFMAEVSDLRKTSDNLNEEVKVKDLEAQTIPGLALEASKLRSEVTILLDAVGKNKDKCRSHESLPKRDFGGGEEICSKVLTGRREVVRPIGGRQNEGPLWRESCRCAINERRSSTMIVGY